MDKNQKDKDYKFEDYFDEDNKEEEAAAYKQTATCDASKYINLIEFVNKKTEKVKFLEDDYHRKRDKLRHEIAIARTGTNKFKQEAYQVYRDIKKHGKNIKDLKEQSISSRTDGDNLEYKDEKEFGTDMNTEGREIKVSELEVESSEPTTDALSGLSLDVCNNVTTEDDEMDVYRREIEKLEEEIESNRLSSEKMDQELMEHERTLSETQSSLIEVILQKSMAFVNEQIARRKALKELDNEQAKFREKINDVCKENDELKEENFKLEADVKISRNKIDELEKEVEYSKRVINDTNKKMLVNGRNISKKIRKLESRLKREYEETEKRLLKQFDEQCCQVKQAIKAVVQQTTQQISGNLSQLLTGTVTNLNVGDNRRNLVQCIEVELEKHKDQQKRVLEEERQRQLITVSSALQSALQHLNSAINDKSKLHDGDLS